MKNNIVEKWYFYKVNRAQSYEFQKEYPLSTTWEKGKKEEKKKKNRKINIKL